MKNNLGLERIHPDLRKTAKHTPHMPVTRRTLWFMRMVTYLMGLPNTVVKGVELQRERIPGGDSQDMKVRIYRPRGTTSQTPALLWMHAGGHVLGSPAMEDSLCSRYARDLKITVIAPDYRLAPEHPFPSDLKDCYAALLWAVHNHARLGIDPARIAIGGGSAGGGLAASLAQYAYDLQQVKLCFQLLVYPMLDDRTVLRTDIDEQGLLLWDSRNNAYAWSVYLGARPGSESVPAYAAPSRRQDLSGLPPAWIGVGTLDLFLEENRAYYEHLRSSGVACEMRTVEGAFHGFDMLAPEAKLSLEFYKEQVHALRAALFASHALTH